MLGPPGAVECAARGESWQQRALNELPFWRRSKHSDEAEGQRRSEIMAPAVAKPRRAPSCTETENLV